MLYPFNSTITDVIYPNKLVLLLSVFLSIVVLFVINYNGKLNLCEVKTTPQIIDNIRNYQDDEEELYNGKYYYDMDNDIIKYKEIGKKLINQVKKLKTVSDDVSVVVFKGCFMDDIIKDKLKELGVEVKVLGVSIHNLKKQVEEIVEAISNEFIRDLKPKLFKYELKNAS